ncbi:MAG: PH domain-containing protein, partial [Candidatus Micrarchaeota archaeon]
MEGEKSLWKGKPDPKIVWKWTLLKGLGWSILAVILFAMFLVIFKNLTAFFIAIAGAFILSFFWNTWLRKTYEYEITDKNVYFKGGILLKKQSIVPFFKITNMPNTQDVIDQVLAITTVGIQTAGTGGQPFPEITFEGMTNPDEVTEILKQQIEKSRK